MLTKTKIAICVSAVVCVANTGFAKDQNSGRDGSEFAADKNGRYSFGQTQIVRSNPRRHGTATLFPPVSSAERWQNGGNAENTGPDR